MKCRAVAGMCLNAAFCNLQDDFRIRRWAGSRSQHSLIAREFSFESELPKGIENGRMKKEKSLHYGMDEVKPVIAAFHVRKLVQQHRAPLVGIHPCFSVRGQQNHRTERSDKNRRLHL